MNKVLQDDLKERKRQFQSLMAAAPQEFIEWAGNWFHTQQQTFGLDYSKGNGKVTTSADLSVLLDLPEAPKPQAPKVEAKKPESPFKKFVSGYAGEAAGVPKPKSSQTEANDALQNKNGKWVEVMEAPLQKKKAANPVALHLKAGQTVHFKKDAGSIALSIGIIEGFTKLSVKIKGAVSGQLFKVPYHRVTEVFIPNK